MNWMIYNCRWTEMSVRTRKLLILLMFVGQDNPSLEVPPFYVLNRVLFGTVSEWWEVVTFLSGRLILYSC